MKIYPLSSDVFEGETESFRGTGPAYGKIYNGKCVELLYKNNPHERLLTFSISNKKYQFGTVTDTQFIIENSVRYPFDSKCPTEKIKVGEAYGRIVNNSVVDIKTSGDLPVSTVHDRQNLQRTERLMVGSFDYIIGLVVPGNEKDGTEAYFEVDN